MWHYMWAHVSFHLTRWFPRDDRTRIRIVLFLFTTALLIPQLVVLLMEETGTRFCEPSLFNLLVASICFTLFTIGFTVLFSTMEPIPWQIKLLFHIFGCASAILGIIQISYVVQGTESCKENVAALYYLSMALAIFSGFSIVFFLLSIPFWIINRLCPEAVLNRRSKVGICYEPVRCCNCIWHV
ncbi:uncharacterized protein [Oscarella lobularis]|uniref:uncharacterized protein n=1 Tax=Oscarella lobularis TaxID=121494 RepID=UPI003313DFBB